MRTPADLRPVDSGSLPRNVFHGGGGHVQAAVRSDRVVEGQVSVEVLRDGMDGEVAGILGPELDAGGVVAAFDAAVELRSPRREDLQGSLQGLAGILEVGAELAAAVDLDGAERTFGGPRWRRWWPRRRPDRRKAVSRPGR